MKEGFQKMPHRPKIDAELVETDENGLERFKLTPGTYQAAFGFRDFGRNENDWFSKASDNKADWGTPFVFDYEHTGVKAFEIELFSGADDIGTPAAFELLTKRFGERIKSMSLSEPEFNNSLSDVVTNGQGTCDAKSVLFGALLSRNTSFETQAITGQYGQVRNKVSYPWSHQWMRISDGKNLYLFDPMYEKLAIFEQEGSEIYAMNDQDAHFIHLTPGCYPAAKLINSLNLQRCGGVNIVESYDGKAHEVYVPNPDSLPAQLTNKMNFVFEVEKEGIIDVHNRAIKTQLGDSSSYFPIQSIEKVE